MNKPKLLVSACLLGVNVEYNGGSNLIDEVQQLQNDFDIFSICPEVQGGMLIPRIPSEVVSLNPIKVQNEYGIDTTDFFISGAVQSLEICKQNDIKIALLKSKSPSCGNEKIYDGSFSGKLIDGIGVTVGLLLQNNIKVFNENQIKELYEYIAQ